MVPKPEEPEEDPAAPVFPGPEPEPESEDPDDPEVPEPPVEPELLAGAVVAVLWVFGLPAGRWTGVGVAAGGVGVEAGGSGVGDGVGVGVGVGSGVEHPSSLHTGSVMAPTISPISRLFRSRALSPRGSSGGRRILGFRMLLRERERRGQGAMATRDVEVGKDVRVVLCDVCPPARQCERVRESCGMYPKPKE